MSLRIVTDSSADMSPEDIINDHIEVLSLDPVFPCEEEPVHDVNVFWEKAMKGEFGKTSQPTPGTFISLYQDAKEKGDDLLLILISSRLSGTYSTAMMMKNMVEYPNIQVVDSLGSTLMIKELVRIAVEMGKKGKTAYEIKEYLDQIKLKVRIYACLDTLEYLYRGGRLSKALYNVGTLIKIKPIICFNDGKVKPTAKAIGFKNGIQKMVDIIKNAKIDFRFPVYPIFSYKTDNVNKMLDALDEQGVHLDRKNVFGIGATMSTHIGPNAFGIVYIEA